MSSNQSNQEWNIENNQNKPISQDSENNSIQNRKTILKKK